MCRICKSSLCLPRCPEYEGESAELGAPLGKCEECGAYVYDGELYFAYGRLIWCADCAEALE